MHGVPYTETKNAAAQNATVFIAACADSVRTGSEFVLKQRTLS